MKMLGPSVDITATAGNSFLVPLVSVPNFSLYQEVCCVLYLHAPPSESLEVSYTNISVTVPIISELICERFLRSKSLIEACSGS